MKRIAVVFIGTLLSIMASAQGFNSKGGSHRGANTPYTAQETQASTWSGSGIALNKTVLATNNHVVDGATHLYVYFPESKEKFTAEVLCTDATNDLALVQIKDSGFKGFPDIQYGFKKDLEDVGTEVYVLGYPRVDTMGEEVKLTTGVVSSRSGFQGNQSQYQVSAPIQPGNSGGPLLNDNGELIGIVSAKHVDGAENVSYAVKLSYLNDLVTSSGINGINFSKHSQIASQKLKDQCKAVIPCTVMVLADNASDSSTSGRQSGEGITFGVSGNYPLHVTMPIVDEQNSRSTRILAIELYSDTSSFFMTIINQSEEVATLNVSPNTYLRDSRTGTKYPLIDVQRIAVAPDTTTVPANSRITFTLVFKPVPADVPSLDLIEDVENGWRFYGIKVN